MTNNMGKYGDDFQQRSKYTRNNLPRHQLDWSIKPKTYKSYPDAIKTIDLPVPKFDDSIKFWNVIINRKSIPN